MMEEGYKIRNRVWKKEKYNIAQNESIPKLEFAKNQRYIVFTIFLCYNTAINYKGYSLFI